MPLAERRCHRRFMTVPPGSSPSSERTGDTVVARLVRVASVKVDDKVILVSELGGGYPRAIDVVEPEPMNEVLELAAMETGVQDGFNFPVFFSIDDVWKWMFGCLSGRKSIGEVPFE